MKYPIYNQNGESQGSVELPAAVFEVPFNADLVHQSVLVYQANKRQGTAHTKTRGEVSGGGRKQWRQKGTGRARHGSTRSPIWIGGGVAFGPRKDKVYSLNLPKKMKRKALLMTLSEKAKAKTIIVLKDIKLEEAKTKLMTETLSNLREKIDLFGKGRVLIVLPKKEETIIRAARNLQKVKTIEARELNSLNVLSFKYLIIPEASIKVIESTFIKSLAKVEKSVSDKDKKIKDIKK